MKNSWARFIQGIALMTLVLLSLPAGTDAAPRNAGAIGVRGLKAAVVQDGDAEDLVLEMEYQNARGPFAWIVPLPAAPEIRTDPPWLLSVLKVRAETGALGRSVAGLRASPPEILPREIPPELARGQITEARVRSGSVGDLLKEIRASGLDLLAADAAVLDEYARRGWVFAVLRVTPPIGRFTGQIAANGSVGPVRFEFRSSEPICPLRANAWLEGETRVQVFVVAAGPVVADSTWETHHQGPIEEAAWDALDPTLRFTALAESRGHLTALSTRGAASLPDPVLRPYDPLPDLRSASVRVRTEAASCLGWTRSAAGMPPLTAWLGEEGHAPRSRIAGEDLLSGLWALGEIGDTAAVSTLLPWTASADVLARLEATESLRRLGTRRALPVFLRGLMNATTPTDPQSVLLERRACLDGLVALGDPSVAPQLRGLAAGNDGEQGWMTLGTGRPGAPSPTELTLGLWSIVALAACGDEAAAGVIRRAMVAQGMECGSTSWLEKNASMGGSVNDFPRGFWAGKAILFQRDKPDGWLQLTTAFDLLGARPALRDVVLRGAVRDPGLPDAARLVLLAHLDHPDAADLDELAAIWDRALANGPILEILVPLGDPPGERLIGFNINACGVAYALARAGEVDRLLALARSIAPGDSMLAAEVVHALAWSNPPRGAERVVGYVREVWGRAAQRPGALDALARRAALMTDAIEEYGVYAGLDLPYRVRRFTRFLCADDTDPAWLEGLIADRALTPGLRLYWILNARFDRQGRDRLREVARASLDQIAAEAPHDSRIAVLVAAGRRRLGAGSIPSGE